MRYKVFNANGIISLIQVWIN